MKLFEHKHYWRPKTDLNPIKQPGTGGTTGGTVGILLIEDCSCGLVRTIEVRAGDAPVIRVAMTPPTAT